MGKVKIGSRVLVLERVVERSRWKCVLYHDLLLGSPWDHLQAEQRSTNEHVNLQSPFVSIPPTGAPTKRR